MPKASAKRNYFIWSVMLSAQKIVAMTHRPYEDSPRRANLEVGLVCTNNAVSWPAYVPWNAAVRPTFRCDPHLFLFTSNL